MTRRTPGRLRSRGEEIREEADFETRLAAAVRDFPAAESRRPKHRIQETGCGAKSDGGEGLCRTTVPGERSLLLTARNAPSYVVERDLPAARIRTVCDLSRPAYHRPDGGLEEALFLG